MIMKHLSFKKHKFVYDMEAQLLINKRHYLIGPLYEGNFIGFGWICSITIQIRWGSGPGIGAGEIVSLEKIINGREQYIAP